VLVPDAYEEGSVVFAGVSTGVANKKELDNETVPLRLLCASAAVAACFNNEADETDFRSMSSERLRFFKIGFWWWRILLERRLLRIASSDLHDLSKPDPGCKGP
jgi:hypothetical protein